MASPFELFWALGPEEGPAVDELPSESEILRALETAARRHPLEADYRFLLGQTLVENGRTAEAIPWLEEAARLQPADALILRVLGRALLAAGRPEDAEAALREALRLRPDDPETANALGVGLLEAAKADQAVVALESLMARQPRLARLASNVGAARFALGRTDPALQTFRRAVRLQPRSAHLRRNLALALEAKGEAAAAVASLRQALVLEPLQPGRHLDLADCLHRQGRREEAEAAYEAALGLDADCLARRPESQQYRWATTLAAIREELATPRRPAPERALHSLSRAIDACARFAGRRRGLDLVLTLLFTAAAGSVGLALLRPWVLHHRLHDEAVRIARLPTDDDALVQDQLLQAAQRLGLAARLDDGGCDVRATSGLRRIRCAYSVSVELLPGLRRPVAFQLAVEEPFVSQPEAVQAR
jgi:tetratricopeptide (TPR) repeat protein